MSNKLPFDKQVTIVASLAEGCSIRGVERMTGVHRDTIMRLGAKVGNACADYMDSKLVNLNCQRVEIDELWGFIAKKNANCRLGDYAEGLGDVYTYVAMDAQTKLVPCFRAGKRDEMNTVAFLQDLRDRVTGRIEISSDGWRAYANAVDKAFGCEVDYGQNVKVYSSPDKTEERRYSPAKIANIERSPITGEPAHISTSLVEKQNHTVRMHCRRLARLTNAFSKKFDNFQAAVSLHFAYYNFVKTHSAIRMTPAMAAGVEQTHLEVANLVELAQ